MKVIVYITLLAPCVGHPQSGVTEAACSMLYDAFANESEPGFAGENCERLRVTHSESVSGGYCLASITAAGYYRAGTVNPIISLVSQLSGEHGNSPVETGSNSGGTMFIVRYFAYRDIPNPNKWTYPCYMLDEGYKTVCYFHGNFGIISEECYAETQNLVGVASSLIYGGLQAQNGGPLGVVASYCSVYFSFLSNLPIPPAESSFTKFWSVRAHWNADHHIASNWVAALTLVNPLEASAGQTNYNFGFKSYLSRGMDAGRFNDWYSNLSVFSAASISANTLSGVSMIPFDFAGVDWDNSEDDAGVAPGLKMIGLLISYIMIKRLQGQHTILVTRLAAGCESACPALDGGFSDNGPVTPLLAAASRMPAADLRPRHLSLLGPSSTVGFIKYLLGTGPTGLSGAGMNLCPFTQTSICTMITQMRKLTVPFLDFEGGGTYASIAARYDVYRPDQQALKAFCADPLVFDHFSKMCEADGLCHLYASAVPGKSTNIEFTASEHYFVLSMLYLAPTPIATRFVKQYLPEKMRQIEYYRHMDLWFPNFVVIAPQKGGAGFTKVAGHSLLDYLTYLAQRLLASEIWLRVLASRLVGGHLPPCGHQVFSNSLKFQTHSRNQAVEGRT